MPTKFKNTRIAVVLMIAASLIAPSVNAGSAVQLSTPGYLMSYAQVTTTTGADIILADHRRGPRANGTTMSRRDFCRAYPRRCNIARDGDRDRGRDRDRDRDHGRDRDRDRDGRDFTRDTGRDRDRDRDIWRYTRDDHHPHFRHGYRGERTYRRGYRRGDDGWWYPLAAFALGAIILNELNDNNGYNDGYSDWSHIPERNMYQHDNWCDSRYRSYSRATKTFQPYHGPRRYCNSPYDLI